MLSRRNIRIKVMQCLYAINRDATLENDELAKKSYHDSIDRAFELYLFNFLQLREVAKFSLKDQAHRRSKHLPSAADKQFEAKLYTNPLVQSTLDNGELKEAIKKSGVNRYLTEDNTRILYNDFVKTEEYKAYLKNENATNEDHRQILLFLYKYSVTGEPFNELMEDYYPNWWDDKSLVVGAIKKTIKAFPVNSEYIRKMRPTYDTVTEFGQALLLDVKKKDAELLSHIEPTLNNWDADRVAIIDMILLKMALSELINFPTIPTKVTLNEFVEIAKLYSTDKSKDFINGILDRLLKKLNKEGKISKTGRGLVE